MGIISSYYFLLCVFVIVHTSLGRRLFSLEVDPDFWKNVTELISSKGYPVENHVVVTQDGNILQIQRIPYGRNGTRNEKKQVVLIMHGLAGSAADFVMNFADQSLGFILADSGYDVWLGNNRGNTYSRRHVKYTRKMPELWNFSFDENAKYDIPAIIDYILNETKQEQLYYIGHSQGNTAAFALLSENQEYNKKIKLLVALAPVAFVGHINGPLWYIAQFIKPLEFLANLLGINEVLKSDGIMSYVSQYLCDTELRGACEFIIFIGTGFDLWQLNTTRLGVYSHHTPAGTSVKCYIHYGQLVKSRKFTKYDYGSKNELHYNQSTPPEYDVSKITTPVALMWGENDYLADPTDVSILRDKLKNVVSDYKVPYSWFSLLDFAIALNVNEVVYNKVLQLLDQHK
ncbi:hypothetical protein JTE90_016362 [Oedothorax gibbosus]|uniref:Lipase n=1 Tax=Oedothorax gibbosus TaxID=931172 RepID=A0AAV6U8X3_9ARAC|nr:hypothetical protein JTE90_016362 [Oedothorax gibbosus]